MVFSDDDDLVIEDPEKVPLPAYFDETAAVSDGDPFDMAEAMGNDTAMPPNSILYHRTPTSPSVSPLTDAGGWGFGILGSSGNTDDAFVSSHLAGTPEPIIKDEPDNEQPQPPIRKPRSFLALATEVQFDVIQKSMWNDYDPVKLTCAYLDLEGVKKFESLELHLLRMESSEEEDFDAEDFFKNSLLQMGELSETALMEMARKICFKANTPQAILRLKTMVHEHTDVYDDIPLKLMVDLFTETSEDFAEWKKCCNAHGEEDDSRSYLKSMFSQLLDLPTNTRIILNFQGILRDFRLLGEMCDNEAWKVYEKVLGCTFEDELRKMPYFDFQEFHTMRAVRQPRCTLPEYAEEDRLMFVDYGCRGF